jgi:hypothetical protein
MELDWTDPKFIEQVLDKLLTVPVLFFTLVVLFIFWRVIRMQGNIINEALNGKDK